LDFDAVIALAVAVAVGWAAARLARVAQVAPALARLAWVSTAAVVSIALAVSLGSAIAERPSPARTGGAASSPNVVLVVADSLRADYVGAYGASRALTPRIDALAARGARFEIAYAAASNTPQALAALLTGRSPRGAAASGASLASAFAAAGYATHAVTADASLEGSGDLARGFSTFTSDLAPSRLARHAGSRLAATLASFGLWSPPAGSPQAGLVVDEALACADSSGPPFFLFLHLMDAHDPYTPSKESASAQGAGEPFAPMGAGELSEMMAGRRRAEPQDLERLRRLYAGAVSSIDAEVGRLLRGLESRGLSDRTIVAFTSDHGEEFIEHGGLGHDDTLYEELVRVPLVIAGPGVAAGLVVKEPVRAIDVAPTLAEAVGAPAIAAADGASAWGALARGEPLTERKIFLEMTYVGARHPFHLLRSCRFGDQKVIGSTFHVDGAGPWRWELYDLAADPLEKHDLAPSRPGDLAALRTKLDSWVRR
ncbi:MAG: sulfatase-like hydrolase/transferase, partial [Acidobacteria bacterium]|nr:sulfatase-like hydrolase/transferase [Acidobacteriota bacterium]